MAGGGAREAQPAVGFADGIVLVFLACIGALATIYLIVVGLPPVTFAWALGYLLVAVLLQVAVLSRPVPPRPLLTYGALLGQAIAVFVPYVHLGGWWLGVPGVLVGSVLLAFPAVAGWPLAGAVVLAIGLLVADSGAPLSEVVLHTSTAAFTGLTVYGLTRLSRVIRGLRATRSELARMAVDEQRLQFARQLQALLGERLSEIMARSERIMRSLHRPAGVQEQVEDMLTVTREALAEVRSVAKGYRVVSLSDELASASAVLRSADVEPRVDRADVSPADAVTAVLSAVLREAVTNVLRHSDARWCEITVRPEGDGVRMVVTNDGAPGQASGGGGVTALSQQLAEIDGNLTAGPVPDGRYQLSVWAPLRPSADMDEPGPGRPDLPQMTRRLANGVLTGVLGGFGVIAVARVVDAFPDAVSAVTSVLYVGALLALQIGYFGRRSVDLRSPLTAVALLVQAALVYVPMLQFGDLWRDMPGFLAGSLLVVLPSSVAVPLFCAIAGSVALLHGTFGGGLLLGLGLAASAAVTGLVVYGLTRLARVAGELHDTRNELAALAVADERVRFARDVHDLLGLSLSAIALKAELANRLLMVQPAAVAEQLDEIVSLCRKALGDVRSVANGYQQLSLEEELASARSVLSSADIDVRIDEGELAAPEPVRAALATVVREGVTNVLRHSKAEWCEVELRRDGRLAVLQIRNNGVQPESPADRSPTSGQGLVNLKDRVSAFGGSFSTALDGEATYVLRAAVPAGEVATASRSPWRSG